MITLKKLRTLTPQNRLKKTAALLREFGGLLAGGRNAGLLGTAGPGDTPGAPVPGPADFEYLAGLCGLLLEDLAAAAFAGAAGPGAAEAPNNAGPSRMAAPPELTALVLKVRAAASEESPVPAAAGPDARELGRLCDTLHYRILALLGVTPGDWDFCRREAWEPGGLGEAGSFGDPGNPGEPGAAGNPGDAGPPGGRPTRPGVLPMRVYLDDLRSPFNVGSIFRTAEAFGAERLILSPHTPGPEHPRTVRSAMGAAEILPWERAGLAEAAGGLPVFALELGGRDIREFPFPDRGMVIVGSEELGLSAQAQGLAAGSLGKVSIPLRGNKASLNAGVALGILLHAWASSLSARRGEKGKGAG